MIEKDITVSKALQERFIELADALKIRFPVAKISKDTGYKSSIVSEYLNGKKNVSEKFMRIFCETYGYDYKKENERLQQALQIATGNKSIRVETIDTQNSENTKQSEKDVLHS